MAIASQVFPEGSSNECVTALKNALDASGFFDEVTLSDKKITCTKDSVNLLEIDLGVEGGGDFLTWTNSAGDVSGSFVLSGSATPDKYTSISTVGGAVFCIFSTTASVTGKTVVFTLAVDQTKDGDLCLYYSNKLYSASPVHYTVSSNGIAADSSVGVTSPISTNKSGICLYSATAQNRNGSCDAFAHISGIRFSPNLHSNDNTIAGVTPVKFTVDGHEYLTDGYIAIVDTGV